MSAEREAQFQSMVQQFPDSPMGHFSLGRYYLAEKRFGDAAGALEAAVKLDPDYAAAFVALGDARAGAKDPDGARAAWQQALATPLGKRDLSLQSDLEQRLRDLEDFG